MTEKGPIRTCGTRALGLFAMLFDSQLGSFFVQARPGGAKKHLFFYELAVEVIGFVLQFYSRRAGLAEIGSESYQV